MPGRPPGLQGLYEGVPLPMRGGAYTGPPDRITLYRSTIQREAATEADLVAALRQVVVHEVAHLMGLSDRQLRDMGRYRPRPPPILGGWGALLALSAGQRLRVQPGAAPAAAIVLLLPPGTAPFPGAPDPAGGAVLCNGVIAPGPCDRTLPIAKSATYTLVVGAGRRGCCTPSERRRSDRRQRQRPAAKTRRAARHRGGQRRRAGRRRLGDVCYAGPQKIGRGPAPGERRSSRMHLSPRFHRQRALVPVLALTLALAGCGGSVATSAVTSGGTAALTASLAATTTAATSSAATTASAAATTSSAVVTSSAAPVTSSASTASAAVTTSAAATSSAATSSAAAVTTSAASTASAAAASSGSAAITVQVRTDPKLGPLLTDPAGRTLYWYTKDTAGVSNCTGGCLAAWPAFGATGALALPAGTPGTLGTITRTDNGATQVTYDNMPLYYYAKDAAPGDTTGQGVGKIWWVVTPTAGPLVAPTPAS
jgi:predicted lipoprotein with Yx(FWY)xxD motif